MSVDRRFEHHGSRRHRSSRSSSRGDAGLRISRDEPLKHEAESSQALPSSHRSGSVTSHPEADRAPSTKRERRRSRRQRSESSLPSPPIETPITAVLSDLRDDIEETNISPQHTRTFYEDSGEGDNALMRGGPLGPVYVENRSGFSQVSRERAFVCSDGRDVPFWGHWHQSDLAAAPTENKPVHLAINVQSCWIPFATFCHGILAGVSLMQTIFVEVIALPTANNLSQFASIYSKLSQLFSSSVYILTTLCFISVLDRMDISHADCRQFLDLCNTRPRVNWLLVPLYSVALILTLLAARTDDWLTTDSTANISRVVNATRNLNEKTDLQMFDLWRIYNIVRCSCVVLGWLILATARPKDLLLRHLKTMLRPVAAVRMP